jgi:glycyl-radical enzyme activating protein
MENSGVVKAIEQFAVHDGPGARLIVFLKGCMLRCRWCQNPETLIAKPEIWFKKLLCKDHGNCVAACPEKALTMDKEHKIIYEKCNQCLDCVKVCKPKAIEVVGAYMTAEALFNQIMKYKYFFSRSKEGGVTISGGDPLFQLDFTADVLQRCQDAGIHTAIETSLHSKFENVWKLASRCDTMICDLKHMDSDKHKQGTGVPNTLILENFVKLNKAYTREIAVHIPLIPGYNDDEDNIRKTVEFLSPLDKVKRIDLLPFNPLPIGKYLAMGKPWEYERVERQPDEVINRLREIAESYKRFIVSVGGLW